MSPSVLACSLSFSPLRPDNTRSPFRRDQKWHADRNLRYTLRPPSGTCFGSGVLLSSRGRGRGVMCAMPWTGIFTALLASCFVPHSGAFHATQVKQFRNMQHDVPGNFSQVHDWETRSTVCCTYVCSFMQYYCLWKNAHRRCMARPERKCLLGVPVLWAAKTPDVNLSSETVRSIAVLVCSVTYSPWYIDVLVEGSSPD